MSTEGQDSATGKHIYYEARDPLGITDDARAVLRQGVSLVLDAGLGREEWADFLASLRMAVDRGTPASQNPAVQVIPGFEAWADANRGLLGALLVVLTLLGTWALQQLDSDPAPVQVEVNINQEMPRPSDEAIDRAIEEQLRGQQQGPPAGAQHLEVEIDAESSHDEDR